MLRSADQRSALIVDPGDARPVAAELANQGLTLTTILITHHHPDHVGGLHALRQRWPHAVVYGPRNSHIAGIDRPLDHGDRVHLPQFETDLTVLAVPGHTLDHLAFWGQAIGKPASPRLFCGDTLFAGGCGRLFEGSPRQMLSSLQRLAALPPATLIYCAHEYTLANLQFAYAVEPGNPALADRIERTRQQRAAQQPSVPTSMALELATNPFLRTAQPAVRAAVAGTLGREAHDEVEVFAALRRWKDQFPVTGL